MSDPDTIDLTIRSKFDAAGTKQAQDALKGLTAAQRQASADAARSAQDQAKIQQATARTAAAQAQAATAAQRLGTEQARQAKETSNAAAAATRAELADIRLAAAKDKVGKSASYSAQLTESFKQGIVGIVGPAAAAATALGAVTSVAKSFGDAFQFKAELDATTHSVELQLKGVRDSGRVFAEAAAFGKEYAFTQQEMSTVTQASVGILRQSTSSFTDLAGVLARLQVLAPGKTIEDAAFSVRELASGDITSIAEQFNISRQKAYEMRDAINSGADVVQVLKTYLDNAGVGMDTLAARTQGAVGRMNELKRAQEDLTLAQAAWAQGPGMQALDMQTRLTLGLTRAMGGGGGLTAGLEGLAQGWQNAAVQGSVADAVNEAVAGGLLKLIGATQDQAAATGASGGAWGEATEATAGATQAMDAATKALVEQISKQQDGAASAKQLADVQAFLADVAPQVAGGILSDASAAGQLAARYGIAYEEALKLIRAQAALAKGSVELARVQGAARIAQQGNRTMNAATGTFGGSTAPVANAPGRAGAGDNMIAAIAAQQGAARQAAAAQRTYNEQIGGSSVVLQNLKADLDKATKGSADYYAILTKIDQVQDQADKAAARGGKSAASKAAKEAKAQDTAQERVQDILNRQADYEEELARKREKAAQDRDDKLASIAKDEGERLAEIQTDSATKLDELNQSTAKKREDLEKSTSDKLRGIRSKLASDLAAIDAKAAADQENAARGLGESIASSLASANVANAADNLDLAGAGADPALLQREAQQAARQQALAAAGQRAQSFGDASVGAASFAADQQMIQQRAQLDEAYAQKQQELAGNPQALQELDAYYQQAIAAEQAYVAQQVAAAQQEAEVKAAQIEQEKEQARAAAEAERKAVLAEKAKQTAEIAAEAEAQRAKIETEAQAQRDAAVAKAAEARDEVGKAFEDQSKTIDTWASDTETDIQRVIDKLDGLEASAYKAAKAMKSVPSGGSAASGGSAPTGAAASSSVPGRAAGGPVDAGTLYQVNERGRPEYFVPDQSGMIYPLMPNASALGGGAMSITFAPGAIVVNAAPNMDTGALAAQAADLTYKRFKAELSRRSM